MPGAKKGRKESKQKKKKKDPMEKVKLEIAEELGLLEKVRKHGWGGLSSRESGRIGGYMTKTAKERKKGESKGTGG